MSDAPTHWTQFDRLYDLPDPRPYFRGVATGDYRMPGVASRILNRLMPVLAQRAGRISGEVRMVDFACGYGAVGICLRTGMTMTGLSDYFAADGDPRMDAAYFASRRVSGLPAHRIDGVDIATTALDYGVAAGAMEMGHSDNVLDDEPLSAELSEVLSRADLIYECGAIGDHVAGAADALLTGSTGMLRPWMILCPRPRVGLDPLREVLSRHGYRLEVLAPAIRYRRPFSSGELAEEIAAGVSNGLDEDACTVDGFFRVDVRLAVPSGEDASAAHDAMVGLDGNAD